MSFFFCSSFCPKLKGLCQIEDNIICLSNFYSKNVLFTTNHYHACLKKPDVVKTLVFIDNDNLGQRMKDTLILT